ncbi:MAG: hypothetical protein ABH827_02160 [bacterium]
MTKNKNRVNKEQSKLLGIVEAFTLIELVCYVSILTIVMYFVFAFILTTQKEILSQDKVNEQLVRDLLVLDLLKRDLMSASMKICDWSPDNTIFTKKTVQLNGVLEQQAVYWTTAKNGLSRRFGQYNFFTQEWSTHHTDFFACSITNLFLVPQKNNVQNVQEVTRKTNNNITGVLVKYSRTSQNSRENTLFIRLRNRRISK